MVTFPMFVGHVLVLSVLIVWCLAYGIQDDFQIFQHNMHSPFPDVVSTSNQVLATNSALGALYFGYSSALLGITGFETASNYVEEMKSAAVFRSTINWMW
jgi:amino acid transporter